jgi:hypothetical protein
MHWTTVGLKYCQKWYAGAICQGVSCRQNTTVDPAWERESILRDRARQCQARREGVTES